VRRLRDLVRENKKGFVQHFPKGKLGDKKKRSLVGGLGRKTEREKGGTENPLGNSHTRSYLQQPEGVGGPPNMPSWGGEQWFADSSGQGLREPDQPRPKELGGSKAQRKHEERVHSFATKKAGWERKQLPDARKKWVMTSATCQRGGGTIGPVEKG